MAAKKELIPVGKIRSQQTHIDFFEGKSNGVKWQKTANIQAFYIPVGATTSFKFKVHTAKNFKATAERVFLALQPLKNFKKPTGWMPLNGKVAKEPIHSYINRLSQNQIDDGSFNPLTDTMTKGVGVNYLKTFEVDKYGVFTYLTFELRLEAKDIGQAFWLEAFNFLPEWGESKSTNKNASKNQGFIIAAVDSIQILHFFAKKRTEQEKKIKNVVQKTITNIPEELAYGDILDIHISIHTQNISFPIALTIIDNDTKIEVYKDTLSEDDYKNSTSAFQNLYAIKEVHLKPDWINEIGHEVGDSKDEKGSPRNFTMRLQIMPLEFTSSEFATDRAKQKVKEITFTINYKDEWSIDEEEQEWVPQIAEIQEATLVTQKFEECRFEAIKIEDGTEGSPYHLLKQEKNGNLTTDKKTEILEYVAGNKNNVHEITISLAEVKTVECQEAGFDNATARGKSHKNNTFIVPDYDKEKNEGNKVSISNANTNKEKWQLFDHNRFFDTEIFEEKGTRSEETLTFKLAYPYDAYNEHTFLLKYLSFQIKPEYLPVVIQSCRYVRTPVFKVYPDAVFVYHYMYDAAQELYFQDKEVALLSMDADILDSAKKFIREWLYEPFKTIVTALGKKDKLDNEVMGIIDNFLNSPSTTQKIGFHMLADSEEINYAQMYPYKAILYYQMLQIALLPLAIELLLIYLTRGKSLQSKLGRFAKKTQKVRSKWKKFSKENDIKLIYPKLCVNYGMYRQQEEKGNVSTVLEYTLQAKPLLGIEMTKKFEFDFSGGTAGLIAIFTGEISSDINLKYNSYTEEFTLTDNACQQTGNSGIPYREGDIVKNDSYIKCFVDLDLDFEAKGEFQLFWIDVPYSVEVAAEFKIGGTIGIERRFGYHKQNGLYVQDIYYFTGAEGEYKIDASASLGPFEEEYTSGDGEEAEWVKTQILERFTYQQPPQYIIKTFKDLAKNKDNKPNDKTFTSPQVPKVSFTKPNITTNN
ncbi:hypothetical protein CXF68_19890 [Tenacibaculum sp. Bg11-29]|uniref:hypothetical protein n=1 Tax=Tenacibaculum sp. Bg11-29 TaxID=2058306 RepID=UPI000C32F475|nr:hypothetical protein [Tenacibaculum sp. Bg11-29]PKH52817.1 hypothetical protein CXF68_19890 [Tenacibaculum sp. Bg11-29]